MTAFREFPQQLDARVHVVTPVGRRYRFSRGTYREFKWRWYHRLWYWRRTPEVHRIASFQLVSPVRGRLWISEGHYLLEVLPMK